MQKLNDKEWLEETIARNKSLYSGWKMEGEGDEGGDDSEGADGEGGDDGIKPDAEAQAKVISDFTETPEFKALLSQAISKKYNKLKTETDAVKADANSKVTDAEARLAALETELNGTKLEKELLSLVSQYPNVSEKLLRSTKLTGEDLAAYAKDYNDDIESRVKSSKRTVTSRVNDRVAKNGVEDEKPKSAQARAQQILREREAAKK